MNKHKVKHYRKSDTKTANRDHIRTTALERSVMNYWGALTSFTPATSPSITDVVICLISSTDHGRFNRPFDHQSTTNDRLKPVLTTGLVNTHIDRSIANPDLVGNHKDRFSHRSIPVICFLKECSVWEIGCLLYLWTKILQSL